MVARSIKAKLLVFAIFFTGIASGILIANFYTTRVTGSPDASNPAGRAQRAQQDINKFYDYLGLDPKQRELEMKLIERSGSEHTCKNCALKRCSVPIGFNEWNDRALNFLGFIA